MERLLEVERRLLKIEYYFSSLSFHRALYINQGPPQNNGDDERV